MSVLRRFRSPWRAWADSHIRAEASGAGYAAAHAVIDEAASLQRSLRAINHGLKLAFKSADSVANLMGISAQTSAACTVEVRIGAELTDRAARLLAALRAGNVQLEAIRAEIAQLNVPSDPLASASEETESPAVVDHPPAAAGGSPQTEAVA